MNKYKEAFWNIDCKIISGKGAGQSYVNGQYKYDFRAINELVNKATPKKPIKDCSGYLTCDKVQYICPRCNQIMVRVICIKSHKPNYCYKCGQALSWHESEEE
jgi:hypothetical protein